MALLLQALLFGDGGVLTYGVNCFNMAFILPFTSYGIYRLLKGFWNTRRGELFAEILGSYIGLNLAAFTAAVVLGVQPLIFHNGEGHALYFPYPLSVTIPAMMIPHLLVVGALEAAITVTVVGFVRRSAPELIHKQTGDVSSARLKVSGKRTRFAFIWVGLLLLVATPIGLVAGGGAWGEWAADTFMQDTGLSYVPEYIQRGFSFRALLPDYSLKGLPPVAGYLMSAVIGMAVLIIIFKILGHIIANQRQKSVRRAK
jgi:cobalt/nickel transport system permease protein